MQGSAVKERSLLSQYSGVGASNSKRKRVRNVRAQKVVGPGLIGSTQYQSRRSGADRLGEDWDLTPNFGTLTVPVAVIQAAEKVCLHKDNLEDIFSEEKEDEERSSAAGWYSTDALSLNSSFAVDILVGALMQAEAIWKEKRERAARVRDCTRIYMYAISRAKKILLKESDNLRRQVALQGDQDEYEEDSMQQELTESFLLKESLAGDLSKIQGFANQCCTDPYKMMCILHRNLGKIIEDIID